MIPPHWQSLLYRKDPLLPPPLSPVPLKVMCPPPQKKENLSSLDDPKRKESNLFLPVFPRANIFSRDMSTLKLRACKLFYFPSSFSIYQKLLAFT